MSKVALTMNYVGDYIYCTDGNKAAYSTDYGQTWTEISVVLPPEVTTISTQPFSFKCDNTGKYIYLLSELNNYSLLFSNDGGKTYSTIFTNLVDDGSVYSFPTLVSTADFSVIFLYASSKKTFLSSQIFELSNVSSTKLYSLVNLNNDASSGGGSAVNIHDVQIDLTSGGLYLNGSSSPDTSFVLVACVYKD